MKKLFILFFGFFLAISFSAIALQGLDLRVQNTTGINTSPAIFSALPACAAGTEGHFFAVTDSNTVTWGATVAGSSTNHILAYCDGTNWTVAAK